MPLLKKENYWRWVLVGAAVSFWLQFSWFASKGIHQIDIDGIDYTGIARHISNHQFYAAINGFRSPLISWLIAAGSFLNGDRIYVGKALSIGSLLLCAVLLYYFTATLWHSRLAASFAVLWFSFARNLTTVAVQFVTADFLFAALVLVYFILLLRCLRSQEDRAWVGLGAVHGLAFLAKAFALPWLALSTVFAILLSPSGTHRFRRLVLAALIPALTAAAWATVLHSKYGVYTTGTQFRANFLQWAVHAYDERPNEIYSVLGNTRPFIDEDGVNDPMPPNSWPWRYRADTGVATKALAFAEIRNLPKAGKELLIVVTPGGILAFVLVLGGVFRKRYALSAEFIVAATTGLGTLSLFLAYCMLVFDGRYLFPVVPLILAAAVGLFLDPVRPATTGPRAVALALILLGIVFSFTYPSSPFRTLRRDYQVSCYRAGQVLRSHPGSTVVSVGSGPNPEHGVGWEAGYKSAYFGDRRLIAAGAALPESSQDQAVLEDISRADPDAVLVWGRPGDARYETLVQSLIQGHAAPKAIDDPVLGQVGVAIFPHSD